MRLSLTFDWLKRAEVLPPAALSETVKLPVSPENSADFVDSRDCGLVDAVMGGWFQNDSNELFKGFPISADDIVADIGCGAGGSTLFCARRGAHVIFTDTEADKVESVRKQVAETNARKVEGYVSNSQPLPLADEYATRVIALEVLEHVEKPAELLKELYRIGRPGALYFLSVPDLAGEEIQKSVAPIAHFQTPNHINIFSRDHFQALVSDTGLVIESRHYYGFYWSMWMLFYWVSAQAEGKQFEGATHDKIAPPYPALLSDWAKLWHSVLRMQGGPQLRDALDQLMPKSQIIIAQKPMI